MPRANVKPFLINTDEDGHFRLTVRETRYNSQGYPLVSVGEPLRAIARRLGRSPSTISREVRRNGGVARYRATASDQAAWDRALRPKPCKLAYSPSLAQAVSVKLRRKWSPEQIAGWLRRSFPKEPHRQVTDTASSSPISHTTQDTTFPH